jgi:hypothetical protein
MAAAIPWIESSREMRGVRPHLPYPSAMAGGEGQGPARRLTAAPRPAIGQIADVAVACRTACGDEVSGRAKCSQRRDTFDCRPHFTQPLRAPHSRRFGEASVGPGLVFVV